MYFLPSSAISSTLLCVLGVYQTLVNAAPAPSSNATTLPSITRLATFNGFIENIAQRENGELLITSLQSNAIHVLDPKRPNVTWDLGAIEGVNGLSGITELRPDFFVVAAGQWNLTARRATAGSLGLWTVDFTNPKSQTPSNHQQASINHLIQIPEVTTLNGVTHTQTQNPQILISESVSGRVLRVNPSDPSTYDTAIQSPYFEPLLSPNDPTSLGINGIHVHDSFLYFTNSAKGLFGRVPIFAENGTQKGDLQVLASVNATVFGLDDFAVSEGDGEGIYVGGHPETVLQYGSGSLEPLVVGVSYPTSLVVGKEGSGYGNGDGGRSGKGKTLFVNTNSYLSDGSVVGGVVQVDF